ncbi:hypothetical protein PHYSODRAFT_485042 [Phytophthora sojae]|uniref:Uncharacterized protein n=1 Tax=Phytophthora sojae (strain P6497) TaxID=1094619 RepID=G4YZT1_PHYSP|nr:hypothetical protein PHYSODRAFT_485042 [Phytophthora sojae]EGZ26306.1 hypothetical protein PHYSODRAFT_485042 [Phytophthora sojae]|eukprot:XP_009521594.1 hypothetical protein PHYSODRAFT_485042 [Phytophthora sojae]
MTGSIGVAGADAVGKTSFYLWARPGGNRQKKTAVHILRSREEDSGAAAVADDDAVFVLLFDLTRRDSLAAVVAQWAHLSDTPGRRLLLVGTHADCASKREVSLEEVREISGEFHGYEEVCCMPGRSGDEGMLRVKLLLTQWIGGSPAVMASDIPLARASICGGFPRPVVTMMMPNTSHSLPASPAGQRRPRRRADVWLYDPTEEVSSSPVAVTGGDVKLRTISKAIYDIRGAVAEKSKSLAKYRDRQMSHWLTRSRYFGPTESSRHKRWQEEQKKRQQQTQGHVHHHHVSHIRQQSSAPDVYQQRVRSVSHPDKIDPPNRKPVARRGPARLSSSSSSESDESPGTPLERKSFMQPTELTKQRQRQLEADSAQQQMERVVAKRALRKQRRAASNDISERSTASAAALNSYLNCYDEMDMPPQLQPLSPSLDRRNPSSKPSPPSSVSSSSSRKEKSVAGDRRKSFEVGALAPSEVQYPLGLLSPGAEQAGCVPTPPSTAHLQSPLPPVMSPPAPSSVRSHHSAQSVTLDDGEYDFLSDTVLTLTTPDKLQTESKSSTPVLATEEAAVKTDSPPPPAASLEDSAASRADTMCSSSSENFECSDIDDMLEYFEGVTLPI